MANFDNDLKCGQAAEYKVLAYLQAKGLEARPATDKEQIDKHFDILINNKYSVDVKYQRFLNENQDVYIDHNPVNGDFMTAGVDLLWKVYPDGTMDIILVSQLKNLIKKLGLYPKQNRNSTINSYYYTISRKQMQSAILKTIHYEVHYNNNNDANND